MEVPIEIYLLHSVLISHSFGSFKEEVNSIPKMNYTELRMLETDEQRLLRNLMVNYEKSVRPVMKASDLVDLKIGLTLNQIDVVRSTAFTCI